MNNPTPEEAKKLLTDLLKDIARNWLWRGVKIGFLLGLTVGWIAGGMVMLWLN